MKPNIEYVSVLDGIKDIEERNKAFDALDKQSKRLEIAWDALQLLSKKYITPSFGHYWGDKLTDIQLKSLHSTEFQQRLNKPSSFKGCSVCARGAIMLSLIRIGNNISPNGYAVDKGHNDNIKGFSMKSMLRMEGEYEHCHYDHPYRNNTKEKLMNILCNVLVNGDFNPKDKTNYLIP